MHRNQSSGAEFQKSLDRLFWIHRTLAASWRFVSTNRKQSNFDRITVTDFSKPGKVSAVATVKNGSAVRRDDKSAKVAVQVRQKPRAPMMTRCQRNSERTQFDRLPVIELVHDVKTEIMHQISHTHWHDDWLIGGYPAQRAPVEMIEMSVCNQDEINRRQMMNFETWLLEALDYL